MFFWWVVGNIKTHQNISKFRCPLVEKGDVTNLRAKSLPESCDETLKIGVEYHQLTEDR